MSQVTRAFSQAKKNLLSNALEGAQERLAELQERVSSLNHEVVQLRQKLDMQGTLGVYQTGQHEVITKIFSGLKMYLDPRDIAITPHIILDGIWEDPVTKAWLSVQKEGAIVFDVGTHNGYYGALAAQKIGKKDGKVYMFEANPALIPYIQKTLAVNWFTENTVLENKGVADKAGTATLNVLKDYIGSSSMQPVEQLSSYLEDKMHVEAATTVKVPTIALDDYCTEKGIPKIDLMLIDIEGYEQKAYQGMKKMVQQSPRMILFMEFTKEGYNQPEEFFGELLSDFGHLYLVDETNGKLTEPQNKSYKAVVGQTDSWVMLVFAKESLL